MAHCEAMAHLQNYQEATNFLGTCHQTFYRMINSKRKEVYIPIEIKPREFISQLLLGGELAKIGFRVYLGTKKAIDELVENKNNKEGVYLYKGGGGTINKFKKLSKVVPILFFDLSDRIKYLAYSDHFSFFIFYS